MTAVAEISRAAMTADAYNAFFTGRLLGPARQPSLSSGKSASDGWRYGARYNDPY